MTRLIDRIMARQFSTPLPSWVNSPDDYHASRENAMREMSAAEVINVDNVADYVLSGTDQEEFGWDDYPTMAPPFASFWMEYRTPSRMVSVDPTPEAKLRKDGSLSTEHMPRSVGALVMAEDVPEESELRRTTGARWAVNAVMAHEFVKGEVVFPTLWLGYGVRVDGSVCDKDVMALIGANPDRQLLLTAETEAAVAESLRAGMIPLHFATSLMHCKNVELHDDPPPPKLSRRWEKKHGSPKVTVKTLHIEPMRRTLNSEGRAGTLGVKKAMHICRGHFKDYRESGLFGRHKGIFWWDAYVRGDSKSGEVVKDYSVGTDGVA